MSHTLREIIKCLEQLAPPALQESYDNSGLLIGNPDSLITKAVICLDSTEAVLDEAMAVGANLVIAHHPIVFSGLKRFTGHSYIERVVMRAIKNDIAVYAIHTNLDNVRNGVNQRIAQKLGLRNTKILKPKASQLAKLVVFAPVAHVQDVSDAMFAAGAGHIGQYSECSFQSEGKGSFKPMEGTNPFVGEQGERHYENEVRIETICRRDLVNKVIEAARKTHPYEKMAFDVFDVQQVSGNIGSGMLGELEAPMEVEAFLAHLKGTMHAGVVRHTSKVRPMIHRVALCGGSGSFLLGDSIACGADIFITSDYKYHQFFDAEGKIMIADIGHYESEQFTIDLLGDWIAEKLPKFATHLTQVNTNPVFYF